MTQITVSLFGDRSGVSIDAVPVEWRIFCANFAAPPVVADKAQCQLFSLCEFGDVRTERGSLRSNDNVKAVWGVCGDYDGEVMTPEAARDALAAAGLRSLVYTSPSHTPEAPRWRVVAPFEGARTPDAYAEAVERLNGVLGGVLSSESFTLSQPFYVGRVAGREAAYRAYEVNGVAVETRTDLPRVPWRGAQRADGGYRVDAETLLDDLRAGREIHPAIVALAARGYTQEELEDVVSRHCASWERPERGEVAIREDIPRAVNSWQRKKQRDLERKLAAVGTPPPYGETSVAVPVSDLFERVADLTATYRQTEWLIRDIVETSAFAILFGDPGAAKSFLSIDWAACVATGRRWQGRRVRQGPVLYLAGEGFSGFAKRFMAWRVFNGITDAEWKAAPLYVSRRAVNLLDYEAGAEMWRAVEALGIKPALIVIDTLSRMTPGMDENAAKEMSQFVQWCDKVKATFGATVLVVHHSGVADKGRVRGSSALKGAADVEIGVMKQPGDVRRVFNPKMKEGAEFPDMFFKLEDVPLPWVAQPDEPGDAPRQEKSAVLVSHSPPEPVAGDAGRPNKAMDMLRESIVGTMTTDAARDAFCRIHDGGRKTAARAFNRALASAVKAGLVVQDTENDTVSFVTFGG